MIFGEVIASDTIPFDDYKLVYYAPFWSEQMAGVISRSQDKYGHTCTATGALWLPYGRYFDGVDDIIITPTATPITNIWTTGGTVMAWINPASDGEGDNGYAIAKMTSNGVKPGWLMAMTGESAGYIKVRFFTYDTGASYGYWTTDSAVVPINTWSNIFVTYNGASSANDPILYFNGDVTASSEGNAPTGPASDDSAVNLTIGNREDTTKTYAGKTGEVAAWKGRILTAAQIKNVYLATKWRYQ